MHRIRCEDNSKQSGFFFFWQYMLCEFFFLNSHFYPPFNFFLPRSHHALLLFLPTCMLILPVVVWLLHFVPNIPLEQESVKRISGFLSRNSQKGLPLIPLSELKLPAKEDPRWTCSCTTGRHCRRFLCNHFFIG